LHCLIPFLFAPDASFEARVDIGTLDNAVLTNLAGATVVYTCSTAFSLRFMRSLMRKLEALRRELIFVSLQELEPRRRFTHLETLRLDTSWARRAEVHLYQVAKTP